MKIRNNTLTKPKLLILSTSLMLAACGGAGVPGVSSVPSGPPTGSTPAPKPAQTEMRLHADFTIQEQSFLHAKPISKGNYNRDQVITGTLDQAVYVDGFSANDTSAFHGIPNKAMVVNATITEIGQGHIEDPNSSSFIQSDASSSFTGPIINPIDIAIKRSALGVGDEISFRMASNLTGNASTIYKFSNGQTQTLPGVTEFVSLLENDTSSPGDPNTLRKFAKRWDIFPTLGVRPIDPLEQKIYDGIVQFPQYFHQGFTTSVSRKLWKYAGKIVPINTDTVTESTLSSETVAITICLKSATDSSPKCEP